jgi:hypothetical protein
MIASFFISPGRHSYFVQSDEGTYFHKLISPVREEDLPISIKTSKVKQIQRKFRKEHSVFREWREDNDVTLKKACDTDLQ